ncbi:mitochondrial K+-H+ exchange-related-domain-containing protein [Polychytrium aggregatum]|uniref:mitochondrial K+-H+ exchange-related-domain-containing protein n=1 Tax=Polychytrium aggregatum TaxID=110093 RepID=UPI0022FF1DF1|nr:mitochondrial K+-H+ exchange-related-domain-containing protein [Polychytrium aggregatum]KAI9206758.1 mitochondrial K+-H+ exchange-related-domain-containing protein [Polychytrium aggregatum]
MRIIVVPITKTARVYSAHFHPASNLKEATRLPVSRLPPRVVDLSHRAVDFTIRQWDELGSAREGTWARRFYDFGNSVLDRIHAEEWFLKELPILPTPPTPSSPSSLPSSSPSSAAAAAPQDTRPASHSHADPAQQRLWEAFHEPLTVFHPARLSTSQIQHELETLANRRTPYHQRLFILSTLLVPVSCLATILPGPNVFLAYNLFRVYSHWRAYQGARTLQHWTRNGLIRPKVDPRLDEAMASWNWDRVEVVEPQVIDRIVRAELGGLTLDRELERGRHQVLRAIEAGPRGPQSEPGGSGKSPQQHDHDGTKPE